LDGSFSLSNMSIKSKFKIIDFFIFCSFIIYFFQPQSGEVAADDLMAKKGEPYQVIALVNEVRAAYGLSPYTANGALMSAAQAHSDYQAAIGNLTHTGKGGSSSGDRAVAAGYGGGAKVYVTENIYGGRNATPEIAVNWWKNDATHLNTMISPSYTDIGVGIAEGNGVVYYTMDVGYVSGSPAQNSNPKNSSGTGQTSGAVATSASSIIIPVSAATPQADGSVVHTVQPGQALWNIAAIYNISITDLVALNGLSENSFIHPGDKILVRSATDITSTATITVTQTISSVTTASPMVVTEAATAGFDMADTATHTPQIIPSDTSLPTNTVEIQNNPPATRKIDPVLMIIGGLIVVGVFLIILGSVSRKSD